MGTYDTRGGTPISPDADGPEPSALEDAVLGLLEDAEIDTETCDQIIALIQKAERAKFWYCPPLR